MFFLWLYVFGLLLGCFNWSLGFRSWVPSCVFSSGGGRGSVEAWFTTAIDIEEVLSGVVQGDVHVFVSDVIKSFDTVDRSILDRVLVVWVCRVGSGMLILSIILCLGFGLSFLLGWGSFGLGMVEFLRVVH